MIEGVSPEEKAAVSENMQAYGGGFVQSLGVALMRADAVNTLRIKAGFPEYWEKYRDWGKDDVRSETRQ